MALFGALAPANAAVVAPQEQGAQRRLLSGEITLDIEAPLAAAVAATFRLGGEGEVVVLLADLPGQRLEQLELLVDGRRAMFVDERRSSALRALRLRDADGAELLEISYRVHGDGPSPYRFALPVPEAIPTGEERSVRLTVRLPDGANFAGNSFPSLLSTGDTEWTATAVAVPAIAHVVFGDVGIRLWAHRLLEWSSLGVAIAMLIGAWQWSRRRARTLPEAGG